MVDDDGCVVTVVELSFPVLFVGEFGMAGATGVGDGAPARPGRVVGVAGSGSASGVLPGTVDVV